ncbi:MAG: hypothetical protein C0623_07010 [Desulfuromonas sp.]|nr:MAG: hypothetical protein C0623_07010 [Desulfuromonas sp.]
MSLLDQAWEQRENDVYVNLFGDIGEGIYTLQFELFQNQFGCEEVDPRWLHSGVFKSPPNGNRQTWIYVSSGMSNPWESETREEYSGLGTEILLETECDESWAIPLVQSLIAYNILLSVGKFGDKPLLDYGARIPQPIAPNITHLIIGKPTEYPESIDLVSGEFDFLQVCGITEGEYGYAKDHGSFELCELLLEKGIYPITDPRREGMVSG